MGTASSLERRKEVQEGRSPSVPAEKGHGESFRGSFTEQRAESFRGSPPASLEQLDSLLPRAESFRGSPPTSYEQLDGLLPGDSWEECLRRSDPEAIARLHERDPAKRQRSELIHEQQQLIFAQRRAEEEAKRKRAIEDQQRRVAEREKEEAAKRQRSEKIREEQERIFAKRRAEEAAARAKGEAAREEQARILAESRAARAAEEAARLARIEKERERLAALEELRRIEIVDLPPRPEGDDVWSVFPDPSNGPSFERRQPPSFDPVSGAPSFERQRAAARAPTRTATGASTGSYANPPSTRATSRVPSSVASKDQPGARRPSKDLHGRRPSKDREELERRRQADMMAELLEAKSAEMHAAMAAVLNGHQTEEQAAREAEASRQRQAEEQAAAREAEAARQRAEEEIGEDVERSLPDLPDAECCALLLMAFMKHPLETRKRVLRALTLRTHPDKGGDPAAFRVVKEAREAFLA